MFDIKKLPFYDVLPMGICSFDELKDDLLNCRALQRIPQNAKSVIVVLFPYYLGEDYYKNSNISKYAVPADYHKICGEYLNKISLYLKNEYSDNQFECFCDNSPVKEVDAAVLCGLGEIGLHGAILTDEFGPFVRVCFVLTDAEIEPDEVKAPHLCDKCGACVKGCPGKAISEDGKVDAWQCAVYYNGANGTKNPFMPPEAFANFEDRLEIIAGEARVTPETARKILDNIYFYPPAQHALQCSICGRACDMSCYMHLEEKGVLTKSFRTPFRKREEWKFDIEDFKQ
jgi:epoxyqueuosine reductase QueG